jgi:hypothetical protein
VSGYYCQLVPRPSWSPGSAGGPLPPWVRRVGQICWPVVGQFKWPLIPPPRLHPPKVIELTYTSHSLTPFARDLSYDGPPFRWNDERRALLRADLDAFYARAYGLTRDEVRYILDPADVRGPDYPSETFRVLKDKEIRQFGEYRTRRLVLAAWDRMEAEGEFSVLGL